MTSMPRYADLPPAPSGGRSAWGLFGPDDSVGRMNLQTPDTVAAAARCVRKGAVFPLDAPLDLVSPPLYNRGAPRHTQLGGGSGFDDVYDNFYPQASSQWDALCHVGYAPGVFWNGASEEDIRARRRNGIDHWARRGIAARGVVLDVSRAPGGYDPGTAHALSVADLEAARAAAGVELREGDVLVLHTGWLRWYTGQDAAVRLRLARGGLEAVGIEHTEEMAAWLWDSGASAVVADCPALEVWPPDYAPEAAPTGFLHRLLIGQLGIGIGELWWLADLADDCAADGVHECLLTSAPLHMRGGVGSPANALALK